MGCSSVLCLWEEEQGGSIFYKYSGFLHAGLDWAGWASHAGTSQPGGWGVAGVEGGGRAEGGMKTWGSTTDTESSAGIGAATKPASNELPCASEWVNQIS